MGHAALGLYNPIRRLRPRILLMLDRNRACATVWIVDTPFNAAAFFAQLQSGEFEGRLTKELSKLTREQLEQVALLLVEAHLTKKPDADRRKCRNLVSR